MAKASDNVFPYVHVAPAAAPASPAAGSQRLFLDSADGNKLKRKDSSGTVTVVEGGGSLTYATYTPTLSATTAPTLGTGGSVSGRYAQSGKFTTGSIVVTAGTAGFNTGVGAWKFGLPAAANMSQAFAILGVAYWTTGGGGSVTTGFLTRLNTNEAQVLSSSGAALNGGASGITNGDYVMISFTYEAA